jgi:hypothetical protein
MFKIYFLNTAIGFFIGGGMVYFYFRLKNTKAIESNPEKIVISDEDKKTNLKKLIEKHQKIFQKCRLYENVNSRYATIGDLCSKSEKELELEKNIISEIKNIFIGKPYFEVKNYIEKELKYIVVAKPPSRKNFKPFHFGGKTIILIVNDEFLTKDEIYDFYKIVNENAIVEDIY